MLTAHCSGRLGGGLPGVSAQEGGIYLGGGGGGVCPGVYTTSSLCEHNS